MNRSDRGRGRDNGPYSEKSGVDERGSQLSVWSLRLWGRRWHCDITRLFSKRLFLGCFISHCSGRVRQGQAPEDHQSALVYPGPPLILIEQSKEPCWRRSLRDSSGDFRAWWEGGTDLGLQEQYESIRCVYLRVCTCTFVFVDYLRVLRLCVCVCLSTQARESIHY